MARRVVHRDDRRTAFVRRDHRREVEVVESGSPRLTPRGLQLAAPGAVEPVGRGQVEHRRGDALVGEQARRVHGLGQYRATRGEHDSRRGARRRFGLHQAIATGQHVLAQLGITETVAGRHERRLVDRPRREPQVEALAVGFAELADAVAQEPVERLRVARLGIREAGQFETDRRSDRALVRAALGGQRHAGRGADDDEAGAVVEAVDQGVEPAAHERVVHGADGDEVLAVQLVPEPERVQGEEEVHLAEPELDVAAGGSLLPAQEPVDAEVVGLLDRSEHPELVDPPAQVRAHAHVG